MAATAAGRRGASGLWPGEDLALVGGSHTHGVRGCVCVLRRTGVITGGKHRGCAALTVSRRTEAERLGGAAGVATDGEGLCMGSQERVCVLNGDLALAPPG
jgi:hypothetical protein